MVGIAVDLGPSSKADAGVFLEDEGGDRLVIVTNKGGCLPIIGIGLVAAAAGSQASIISGRFEWWDLLVGILVGAMGGWLLFGRFWTRMDRKRRLLDTGVSLITPHLIRRALLGKYTRVLIVQKDSTHTDSDGNSSTTTTFPVTLEGGPGVESFSLTSAGIWEQAIPISEAMSRFLQIPLEDKAASRTQAPHELDFSLREQASSKKPKKDRKKPGHARFVIRDHSEDSLAVTIPRPDYRPWAGLLAFVVIGWCIPVGFLSREWFTTLLPLFVVGGTAIKCVFGFRSEFHVTPAKLWVKKYGLFGRRSVTFPGSELEDLLVRRFEQGGPRSSLAEMMDGVIVARSDREAIRFGHGLSFPELKWLRQEIHRVITSPIDSKPPTTVELDRPPRVINWAPVFIGWFSGAAIAAAVGGVFTIGIALPFLELVLNLGALLGFLAGLFYLSRKYERARLIAARLVLLIFISVLALDLADLLQRHPSFDAYRVLRYGERNRLFWIGWIPVSAGISLLLAEAAQWAFYFGFIRRKKKLK
jgi:hypothetical protein